MSGRKIASEGTLGRRPQIDQGGAEADRAILLNRAFRAQQPVVNPRMGKTAMERTTSAHRAPWPAKGLCLWNQHAARGECSDYGSDFAIGSLASRAAQEVLSSSSTAGDARHTGAAAWVE